ncbi:enolase C-terminal domain-like protein [Candidimonas nitroreducens]|nr:enolase C-terminal domain-like protein [Candidimonas nitroreducens]
MAFRIRDVRGVRMRAPGPDYWRGFLKQAADAQATGRFQFSPPWRTVYAKEVESALVRVQLADGTVGWGEATCPIAPEVICTLVNGFISEVARHQPFAAPDTLVDMLYDAQRCRGYLAGHYQDAVAALDIALHDALARRAGCPVNELFAAKARASQPCYLSGARAPTREERIELLHRWSAEATTAVKIFLRGSLDADLEEFTALQDAVPSISWWAGDALWTFHEPAVAVRARHSFGQLAAKWLECPMLPEDLAGHMALREAPGAPIALGEHFRTALQAAPWLDSGAVQILQPDIGRTGFVMGRRMLEHASGRHIAVTPHMGGALDVMQAATLHFAASIAASDLPCEYQAGLAGRIPTALRSDWTLGHDGLLIPETPGLGVHVDEDAIQEFIVS